MRLCALFFLALALPSCEAVTLAEDAVDATRPESPAEPWHEMLDAINAARAEGHRCGGAWQDPVPALTWSGRLATAAARHSRDMASRDDLSHVGSDGSRVGDRATREGYPWRRIGENIAQADLSVEQVVLAFLDSPPHCLALMDERYTQMGAAEQDRFWTQVFARPRT
ncbi:MAG: CAP domain-containing protein [Bacteroidota bacterium]